MATILCGIAGAEFGRKAVNDTIGMIPPGEMQETAKKWVSAATGVVDQYGKNVPTSADGTPKFDKVAFMKLLEATESNAIALTAAINVEEDVELDAEKKTCLKVPAGKEVTLINDGVPLSVTDTSGAKVELFVNGKYKAIDDKVLVIAPKTTLGKGSVIGEGVKIWWEVVPVSPASTAPADPNETEEARIAAAEAAKKAAGATVNKPS
jgi:hypothetical protein